MLHKSVI